MWKNVEGIRMNMNRPKVENNLYAESKTTPQSEEQNLTTALQGEALLAHDDAHVHTAGDKSRVDGTAAISVMSGQVIAYLGERVQADDIKALSFSLQQLYDRMHHLYCQVLPELLKIPQPTAVSPFDDLLRRHNIWTQLRAIKQVVSRVELLCILLNDAAAAILDALDVAGEEQNSSEYLTSAGEQEWLRALNQGRWDLAFTQLTTCLCLWQEEYSQLPLMASYFASTHPAIPSLAPLDDMFVSLLDSAGSIFGEILPDFHALSPGDDEIAVTLLYDMMQQVDQLLLQFDLAMEPLHALTEYFTVLLPC